MSFVSLFLAFHSLVSAVNAVSLRDTQSQPFSGGQSKQKLHARRAIPTAFRPASADSVSSHILTLSIDKQPHSPTIAARQNVPGLAPIRVINDLSISTNITIDGQSFKVFVDTGSSDTWVVHDPFTCYAGNWQPISPQRCKFGSGYRTGSNFVPVPNRVLNLTYGSGEAVLGAFGYSKVELGGISVANQTTGFVSKAAFTSTDDTSGMLGLAYPSLTSAYEGTSAIHATKDMLRTYDPPFTTMWKSGAINATFGLAVQRNGSGYLALGGLPPVPYSGGLVPTPIKITTFKSGKEDLAWYMINLEAVQVEGEQVGGQTSNVTDIDVIVDSGTTLNSLPAPIADDINSKFVPPAVLNTSDFPGLYFVDCNATVPEVGVKIGGTVFTMNPADLILHLGTTGRCYTGIMRGDSNPSVLGLVFLKNVLAVFDVGAAEMRFAQRTD